MTFYNFLVDYNKGEIPHHRTFQGLGTDNPREAVQAIRQYFEDFGCMVGAVSIVHGDFTLEQLERIAVDKDYALQMGATFDVYICNKKEALL